MDSRTGRLCCLVTAVLLRAPLAAADDRELQVTVEPVYGLTYVSDHVAHGVGGVVHVAYGVTDALAVQLLGGVTAAPGEPGTLLTWHASAGVVYALDIVRVVPFFEGGLGVAGLATPQGVSPNLGLLVGLGADYMLSRRWSVGLGLRYQVFLTDASRVPAYFTAGPRVTVRFPF